MNFLNDLRAVAEKDLNCYGLIYSASEDTEAVIRRWVNLKLKLISTVPRRVFISKEIQTSKYNSETELAIKTIENKLTCGIDTNSYLSKSIFEEDYTDYLFSDWGICHLHLSNVPDVTSPYFMKRSDKLLFVKFDTNNACLIDIRDHDEDYVFAQKELLQITHDTWPEILEPYRLNVVGVERDINDPIEIGKLRKGGVSVIQRVGNDVYSPMGGGITTAGTSTAVSIETDRLLKIIRKTEDWATKNAAVILDNIKKSCPQQGTLDLHFEINNGNLFVVDMISSVSWKVD